MNGTSQNPTSSILSIAHLNSHQNTIPGKVEAIQPKKTLLKTPAILPRSRLCLHHHSLGPRGSPLTLARDLDATHLNGGGRRSQPFRPGRRRRGGEEAGEEEAVRTRRRGVEGAGGEGGDGGGGGRHGKRGHGKRGHGANTRAEEPAASGSDKRAHVCGAADSCGCEEE